MKGYRFFLEYESSTKKKNATVKNPGDHKGTVIAVDIETGPFRSDGDYMYEAVGGLMDHPDSVVCSTSASIGYLREKCKRIPERLAREIHPTLFKSLDAAEAQYKEDLKREKAK